MSESPQGTKATDTLDQITSVYALLNNTVLFVCLTYQLYQAYFAETTSKREKAMQKRLRETRTYHLMHALSLTSILICIPFCIIRAMVAIDPSTTDCTFTRRFAVSLWQTAKSSLYLYFVMRFEASFQESAHALSKLTFAIFLGAIIVQWIVSECLIIFKWHIPSTDQCEGLPPIYIVAMFSIWDVICTIGLSVLFSSKLYAVYRDITRHTAGSIKPSFVHTAVKVLILSVFASATTIICTLGVSRTGIVSFIVTDTIINCWCIFLMYAKNEKVFGYCCCGQCTVCCVKCYIRKQAQKNGLNGEDVEVAVADASPSPGGDSTNQAATASSSRTELRLDSSMKVRDTSVSTGGASMDIEASSNNLTPLPADEEDMDAVI